MLDFLSPPEIIRLCRGTMTPIAEYVNTLALHLTAQANEQPGVVADLETVTAKIWKAIGMEPMEGNDNAITLD